LLSAQQEEFHEVGDCWDHYFPFDAPTDRSDQIGTTSFISFLRFSLYRPRDIIVMMDIIKTLKMQANDASPVAAKDFDSAEFRKRYAVYLLGEVKDHVSFYHSKAEYEAFLKFFEYLRGRTHFDYSQFTEAYNSLIAYLHSSKIKTPDFFETAGRFLQYLFDLNVISYVEQMDDGKRHVHWCYRERSYANIVPKVKEGLDYEIHYGLAKALNLGKRISSA
jgi:hypothetical protein